MSSKDPFDSTRRVPDSGGSEPPGDLGDRTIPARDVPDGKAPEPDAGKPDAQKPDAQKPAAGAPPRAAKDPLLGAELGGCRIEALLGRGAMGAVYRARQTRLNREVAVKVMRPELLTDERMLERFESEARMVAQFQSPHVVMVHDVGFEKDVHFLVMELVRGKNLREYTQLLAGGRLPVAEALPLLREACKGLEEARRLGIIHRDIKPDNLMLTERGELKIADFGIAKPENDDLGLTMTQELIGTPLYMSPEQCQGSRDIDFRSDMYSLGATFYYLLTGEPPVRASSVYELIQTKTKLENLCLWKALPELDEHHPLSRVVARMTALAPKDRYADYEELAGDLVLVQQGRTMEIRKPPRSAPGRAAGKPAAGARGGRRAAGIAGGLVLLAALGAGGAWWWFNHGPGKPPTVDPPPPTRVNVAAVLAEVRAALGSEGPSPGLRERLAALEAPAKHAAEADALLADVDRGLEIARALGAVARPAALEVPFADLRAYFGRIDAATNLDAGAGPELRAWVAQERAGGRAEATLGALAVTTLASAFAQWRQDRIAATDDPEALGALGRELATIELGRAELQKLVPSVQEALDRELPASELAAARAGLEPEDPPPPPPVDVSGALKTLRGRFDAEGPVASVRTAVEALEPTVPAQVSARDELLDDIQRAEGLIESARGMRLKYPSDPQPPFLDVEDFFASIDRELEPAALPGGELPKWAADEREDLRRASDLQPRVVAACRAAWDAWQAITPTASATELGTKIAELRAAVARARRLFPAAAGQLDGIIDEGAIDSVMAGRQAAEVKAGLLASATKLVETAAAIESLAAWRAQAADFGAALGVVRARLAELGGDPEVEAELKAGAELEARWAAAAGRVAALAGALGDGDLDAAIRESEEPPAGAPGAAEFAALRDATGLCRTAFAELARTPDADKAITTLGRAKSALGRHAELAGAAAAQITRWQEAVKAMHDAAVDMVPVAGNGVRGFYLARTETTADRFDRFVTEAGEVAGDGGLEARRQRLVERLGDATPPLDQLVGILGRKTGVGDGDLPADGISYYEAAACARWFGMSLPTEDEWKLAALGPGGRHTYPWGGDEWQNDDRYRNIGTAPVQANSGGLSWRSEPGREVHHLAGNVAEWLEAEGGRGRLAGGSYRDRVRRDQQQRAAGLDFQAAALQKALPGFGFRMILRPRDYLAGEFANGRYPSL